MSEVKYLHDVRKIKPGLGITNMYNLASLIGASFEIKSVIGKGTAIEIKVDD